MARHRKTSLDKIHSRTIQVTEELFLASLPSKGPYDQRVSMMNMIENKVTMIVTAVDDLELTRAGCYDYLDSLSKVGIRVIHCPVTDMNTPTLSSARRVATIVRREIKRGGRVAFQCFEALGRAPCLMSSYMVTTGMDPADAVRLIRSVQPQSFLTLDQLRFPIDVDELSKRDPPKPSRRSNRICTPVMLGRTSEAVIRRTPTPPVTNMIKAHSVLTA